MLLWAVALVLISSFVYFFMFKSQKKVRSLHKYLTFNDLCSAVSVYIKDRLYIQQRTLVSHEQMINTIAEKQLFKTTLEAAIAGSYKARRAILDEIEAFLVGSAMNITTLDELSCIVFRNPDNMSSNEKFETIMYFIYKDIEEHLSPEELYDEDNQAHLYLFQEFLRITEVLSAPRPLKTAPHLHGFYIDEDDLERYFDYFVREKEIEITVADAVAITAIMIYQKIFGFGPVDTIVYDNSIDEIEIGTCGAEFGNARHIVSPLNSVMVSVSNQLLRLQFLNFESKAALENCIIALAANGEGTFTAEDGYKFTTLTDLRRVTARRPPVSDRWSVNIRKLDAKVMTNQQLLERNFIAIGNTQLVQDTLQLLAWALIPLAWTGEQGSGKTSHVNAYCDLLEPDVAIRALGNIDESQFGNRYPERDMQHLFETPRQSLHEIAGVGRRTKGTFLVMMEVINSESGQEAINNFKSGYVGGMLTGHGDTTEAMVEFMAQLLAMGQSTSSIETTKIVASILSINVKTMKYGSVFCFEKITEVIPREWKIDWATCSEDGFELASAQNDQLYYSNVTNPNLYTVSEIVTFNKETFTYEPNTRPSLALCAKIFFRIQKNRRRFLFNYMKKYFNVDLLTELIDNNILIIKDMDSIKDWM